MKWIVAIFIFLGLTIWLIIGIGFYLSPQNPLKKADAIVVVSGGETEARTSEGVHLYSGSWAPRIIFAGAARDQDISGVSNAKMMSRIAQDAGVKAKNIILEEDSETTHENAKNVKIILKDNDWNSIILVTSPYHQKRAYLSFRSVLGPDFKIINRSATDSKWRKNGWWKSGAGWYLTLNEFQKIIYIYATGNYN
jgi:uncharacterized SAM-binding protein YcdF (DUF218 family)